MFSVPGIRILFTLEFCSAFITYEIPFPMIFVSGIGPVATTGGEHARESSRRGFWRFHEIATGCCQQQQDETQESLAVAALTGHAFLLHDGYTVTQ
ncbi:MAG TPA: hypothetical protein DCR20_02045 [Planctomycetaceae bacterium]|nr:hypothetical protein [Planctomycetaceae bacterium]